MPKNFDLSAYLVIGPENTLGRDPLMVIEEAVQAGFTMIQIRSKVTEAKALIDLTVKTADLLDRLNKADQVALVVNDRLDVVLAAREAGAKVDGIHVGQEDIPPSVCRKYLGEEAIIGLSADFKDLVAYAQTEDVSQIDYFGAGPLHQSISKPESGKFGGEELLTRSFAELEAFAKASPLPVVIGGGVKLADLEGLAKTGVDGFFVISAVTHAPDVGQAAKKMVQKWEEAKNENNFNHRGF